MKPDSVVPKGGCDEAHPLLICPLLVAAQPVLLGVRIQAGKPTSWDMAALEYTPCVNALAFTYPLGWRMGNHPCGTSFSSDESSNCACWIFSFVPSTVDRFLAERSPLLQD